MRKDLSDNRQNIVNNTFEYRTLLKAVIKDISGYKTNDANVTINFKSIEFLLWGQDNTAPSKKTTGQRAFKDYTTTTNTSRKREYLMMVTSLLVEDLKSVVDQWKRCILQKFFSFNDF